MCQTHQKQSAWPGRVQKIDLIKKCHLLQVDLNSCTKHNHCAYINVKTHFFFLPLILCFRPRFIKKNSIRPFQTCVPHVCTQQTCVLNLRKIKHILKFLLFTCTCTRSCTDTCTAVQVLHVPVLNCSNVLNVLHVYLYYSTDEN